MERSLLPLHLQRLRHPDHVPFQDLRLLQGLRDLEQFNLWFRLFLHRLSLSPQPQLLRLPLPLALPLLLPLHLLLLRFHP
jgi:hypothetical protein